MSPKLHFLKVVEGNGQLVCVSLLGGHVDHPQALHASGIGLGLPVHLKQMFLGEQVIKVCRWPTSERKSLNVEAGWMSISKWNRVWAAARCYHY